jgi:hypothetical protein
LGATPQATQRGGECLGARQRVAALRAGSVAGGARPRSSCAWRADRVPRGIRARVGRISTTEPGAYVLAAVSMALVVACFAEAGSRSDETGGPSSQRAGGAGRP